MGEFEFYSDWKVFANSDASNIGSYKNQPHKARQKLIKTLSDMTRGQVILLLSQEGYVNYRLERVRNE